MMVVLMHLLGKFMFVKKLRRDGEPTGNHKLHDNAKFRQMFLYGDGLSKNNWVQCFTRILKQISQYGRKKYAENLLCAYQRVVVQKGLFHQLMHQSVVICIIYFPGFLQSLQVALGIKQVNVDPIKDKFQEHERFLNKTYLVCYK